MAPATPIEIVQKLGVGASLASVVSSGGKTSQSARYMLGTMLSMAQTSSYYRHCTDEETDTYRGPCPKLTKNY